ncbi:MAG: flippase [Bryobacteraceae bacterium]
MLKDRILAKNVAWNLIGLGMPLIVAFLTIPYLIRGFGAERFGLLTFAWALIGYCSLFDLGLGRALTRLVAEKPEEQIGSTVRTALVLMVLLGVGGGLLLAALAPMANSGFSIPTPLVAETMPALLLVAVAIPTVTLTAGLRGILEAKQQFGMLSAIRIVTGVFTFAGPLMALRFSSHLAAAVLPLVLVRVAALIAHAVLCRSAFPVLLAGGRLDWKSVSPLCRFGGWLTVSNLLSPLMVTLDRFLVGALVSVSSVAYYVTPYELVTKLQVVPSAITGVLFPAFSHSLANDRSHARRLYLRAIGAIVAVLLPVVAAMIILAKPVLEMWLGAEFAERGYRVLQLLAAGVLINAAAYIPASFLQASGRPDLTAKFHMLELPFYLLAVVWMIREWGITGAAAAWALRVTADAALLFWSARREQAC